MVRDAPWMSREQEQETDSHPLNGEVKFSLNVARASGHNRLQSVFQWYISRTLKDRLKCHLNANMKLILGYILKTSKKLCGAKEWPNYFWSSWQM
jgi:hypothetical protein